MQRTYLDDTEIVVATSVTDPVVLTINNSNATNKIELLNITNDFT